MSLQRTRKKKGKGKYTQSHPKIYGKKPIDLIKKDLESTNLLENNCLYCDRQFINEKVLGDHLKTKFHKRRVKLMKEDVYTIKDSEVAGGLNRDK